MSRVFFLHNVCLHTGKSCGILLCRSHCTVAREQSGGNKRLNFFFNRGCTKFCNCAFSYMQLDPHKIVDATLKMEIQQEHTNWSRYSCDYPFCAAYSVYASLPTAQWYWMQAFPHYQVALYKMVGHLVYNLIVWNSLLPCSVSHIFLEVGKQFFHLKHRIRKKANET